MAKEAIVMAGPARRGSGGRPTREEAVRRDARILADLSAPDAKRYAVVYGAVITRRDFRSRFPAECVALALDQFL